VSIAGNDACCSTTAWLRACVPAGGGEVPLAGPGPDNEALSVGGRGKHGGLVGATDLGARGGSCWVLLAESTALVSRSPIARAKV